MKQLIIATFILVFMSAAYAGSSSLLHVWHDNGSGVVPSNCDGTIDASEGCPLPMLN
jgi:hypothetical protein